MGFIINMNLDIKNNINFQARFDIRKADDIARYVNELYPRVSGRKICSLDSYACNKAALYYKCRGRVFAEYISKIRNVRKSSKSIYKSNNSNFDKCVSYAEVVKKEKAGNCGESAFLARMIAACNGIRNTKIVYLASNDVNLDHYAVYVEDKKPYIIDSWLGIADYVPNVLDKLKSEYRKLAGIGEFTADSSLNFKESHGNYITNDEMVFSEELVNQLIEKYPDLVLKRKK